MTDTVHTDMSLPIRYADVARGNFSEVERWLAKLESDGSQSSNADAATLRAHLWFADLAGGALPDDMSIARWARDESCHQAASHAMVLCQLARLLAFDVKGVAFLSALADDVRSEDPATSARIDFVKWGAGVVSGENPADVLTGLSSVFERAKKAQLASLAIDTQCAMAIVSMLSSDLVNATAISRRASRMARTEGLPQQQYLANLLLARVRRLNGVPHLATHILNALTAIAPSPYQPWIRWERLLAGTIVGDGPTPQLPAELAGASLDRLLGAALSGDRETLVQSTADLLTHVASVPLVREEAQDLCVGLDPDASTETVSEAMASWLTGSSALPPHGLYGVEEIAAEDFDAARRDVGYIVAGPGRPSRRVLGIALRSAKSADLVEEKRTDRRKIRVETGIAVLALISGQRIGDSDFFRQVYGFDFKPVVHSALLDAVVSRVRKALSGVAALERVDGAIHVEFLCAAALPDPRCAQPLEDRVLRVLVRARDGTAKDAAARLGLPLRTIQDALKELIDGGACIKRRDGRTIAYVIEDTTFAPPTQSGVQ